MLTIQLHPKLHKDDVQKQGEQLREQQGWLHAHVSGRSITENVYMKKGHGQNMGV